MQEKLVGSKALYERLNEKMKNLEVDPFNFCSQIKLYNWRHNFLTKHNKHYKKTRAYEAKLAILITQSFDHVLEEWKLPDDPVKGMKCAILDEKRLLEKFYVPATTERWLKNLHYNQKEEQQANCDCNGCGVILSKVRYLLAWAPAAAPLLELSIQNNPNYAADPASLKDTAMRKVLELELDQEKESLPSSLQEEMMTGPEPRRLRPRGRRLLARWQEVIKEMQEQQGAHEMRSLIQVSLSHLSRGRDSIGGIGLHKNLMIAYVLIEAREKWLQLPDSPEM